MKYTRGVVAALAAITAADPTTMAPRDDWKEILDKVTAIVTDESLTQDEMNSLTEALEQKYSDLVTLACLAGAYPEFVDAFHVVMEDLGHPDWQLPEGSARPPFWGRHFPQPRHRIPAAA